MSAENLVVGAGISGLAAALFLARAGRSVELWESSDELGGLLAPVRFRGLPCDRGAHRVHPAAESALWSVTDRAAWLERPRRGRLILGGRHLAYPLEPLGFLYGLGGRATLELGAHFALRPGRWDRFVQWERERRRPHLDADEGFEAFVLARVGNAAYERFYRPYAEKVWGEHPRRLSRSVAKQRVSMRSPVRALLGSLGPGARPTFLYPRRGMASIVDGMRDELVRRGVVITHGRTATREVLAATSHARIFYSGHLAELGGAGLEHRGLYLLHLSVPDDAVGDEDTYYVPDGALWFGRVSRIDRFSPELSARGEAVLCIEIPEGRWGPGVDFTRRTDELIRQLVDAGILARPCAVIDVRQTVIPRVYPLYRRGWLGDWRRTLDALVADDARRFPIGRQGLFLHCNVDHCVRIAADAVGHALTGGDAAAWRVRAEGYLELRVRD
ncbi:NAD(P)-binding protein [Myxococcota bacterium]|nr:NAD(P)-binding protein [Myxococcota bacterium]